MNKESKRASVCSLFVMERVESGKWKVESGIVDELTCRHELLLAERELHFVHELTAWPSLRKKENIFFGANSRIDVPREIADFFGCCGEERIHGVSQFMRFSAIHPIIALLPSNSTLALLPWGRMSRDGPRRGDNLAIPRCRRGGGAAPRPHLCRGDIPPPLP